MKTLILWKGITDKKPTYKGVVGGALWDQFIVNARRGHGTVYLIDANNVQDARSTIDSAVQTHLSNVYVAGRFAEETVKSIN